MTKTNLLLNTDSYKASHYYQYPDGITHISSYIEARSGEYKEVVFFGLQLFLNKYLTSPITHHDIKEADEFFLNHGLPFNRKGWEYIVNKHGGYLPLEIEAVEEGSIIPISNVLVQVTNTDPECYWLTNYIETALLRSVWYPTTVATRSFKCKQIIKNYLEKTAESLDGLEFKLHDFGARGVSSKESAEIGGVAHLVNFTGSDNILAVIAAREYYHEKMAGFSIPAAEHSTIISWGKEREKEAYLHIYNKSAEISNLVSIVSDSYDLWNAIDNIWGGELKEVVEQGKITLVIRPDSGDPVITSVQVIEHLMNKFSYTVNSKGYKILPPFLRVIQGGGVSTQTIEKILSSMERKKLSAENIVFGMGGELLQKLDRDTASFAMKTSAIKINNEWQEVFKDPITDNLKKSKKGRLALIRSNNSYQTIPLSEIGQKENLLKPVFCNGKIVRDSTLKEIRERAKA